jgi:hypothetical protein
VAEVELKRLQSQEMSSSQKSVRKKLFPRHHSESCIVGTDHQLQSVPGIIDTNLHIGVNEGHLDGHMSGVSVQLENTNIFAATKESDTLEEPLTAPNVSGLLQESNILNMPCSGKEMKMTRKLVKLGPLGMKLLSKEREQIVPSSRDKDCAVIYNMNTASSADAEVKPVTQGIQSPLVSSKSDLTVLNEASFIDSSTMAELFRLKPLPQSIQYSSHMKETGGILHSLNEASSINAGNIIPEKKGTAVIELKFPVLAQSHTVPSNHTGVVMADGVGKSVFVPSLPIVPEKVDIALCPVQQTGASNSAADMIPVGKLYQAIQVGSVVQLVPLCNNSISLIN